MKRPALYLSFVCLLAPDVFGQAQSEIEILRARANAHELKISQLEQEISRLKARLSVKPDEATAAKTLKQAPKAKPERGGGPQMIQYVVKPGDALSRIAKNHQTSVELILKTNSLSNDRIYAGQKLLLPDTAAVTEKSAQPMNASPETPGKHTVKSGETFYSIARIYKVSISSLKAANPEVAPTKLSVGQTIRIDGNAKIADSKSASAGLKAQNAREVSTPVAKQASDTRQSAAKTSSPPASKPSPKHETRTITVNKQITYGQFASQHGASTAQLNVLNGLDLSNNTTLAVGSELYVPKF